MLVEENLPLEFQPNAGWDPRFHVAKCGDLVRSYLIKSRRFLVVYDTLLGPQSGGWLRQEAERLAQGRPIVVVTSHADWDHYFGNQCFEDLPIIGSQVCRARVAGSVGQRELEKKQAEHPACYTDVRLVAPNMILDRSGLLDGGDLTFHLVPTTGHRPDHLALYIPECSTLLPGDCVEDPIPLVDEDSDFADNTVEELCQSLQLMLELQPEWVLANHAAPERGTARLRSNLQYLQNLQQAALAAGSLEDLRREVPADSSWSDFYLQAHSSQVRMAWEQRKSIPR